MADLPYIQAYAHGGKFPAGQPRLIVIHSTEGPMSRGNARALAGPAWFGGPKAGTSAHDIYDPSGGVRMLPDDTIAWHCGPGGNAKGTGSEHCGRVAMTRAQWLSADGQAMLDASARENAARAKRLGIPPRWLSLTQVKAGEKGFCTHNDIRLALGGTTHSDPGKNFPYDWYMSRVQAYYAGAPIEEDDDMGAYDNEFKELLTRVKHIEAMVPAFGASAAARDAGITAKVGDAQATVLAALRVLPPPDGDNGMTDDELRQLAADIAALMPGVLAEQVVDALSTRLHPAA